MISRFFAVSLVFLLAGCASVLTRQEYQFKTTNIFSRSCVTTEEKEKFFRHYREKNEKECSVPDIPTMVEKFLSIRETDSANLTIGDSIAEVRAKGFTIWQNEERGIRMPNTRSLYGDGAMALIGIEVSGSKASTAQEAESLSRFKSSHYGEEYTEYGIGEIIDRICLNEKNSYKYGDNYFFIIVFRNGHVLRRVIAGGSVNSMTTERAFLLCPGDAIGGMANTGAKEGIKSIIP